MSAQPGFPSPAAQWTITYQGVNITADISTMTIEIIYTDRLGGASGDLAVSLSDETGLWSGAWMPAQGDVVSLELGYASGASLPCGDFQVDDLCYESPPDVLNLRCLSAYITPAMRTRRNIGYENQTLSQIAAKIAQKYGLNLIAQADAANVSFARITQSEESDLAFLHRIALAYDYDFTIRGGGLVFYSRAALESAPPVATLVRSDVIRASFRIKSHHTFQAARVSYQSPLEKSLITQRAMAASPIAAGDALVFPARCENGQQALLRAQSALHQANMVRATATILTPGSTALSAGNTVAIAGFGANDGVYMISTAAHRVNRHLGYVTELALRRIESPEGALN